MEMKRKSLTVQSDLCKIIDVLRGKMCSLTECEYRDYQEYRYRKVMIMYLKATIMVLIISFLACGSVYSDVVWSDEFDGDSIDRNTWIHDVGGWGWGNGQFEYDTARQENSYIESGSLVIEARRENYFDNQFTSARMLTQGRFAFKYGSLEARIKFPDTADGLWPAFWLLGNNFPAIDWPMSGETDIVEIGSAAGIAEGLQQEKINCAIHFADVSEVYGMDASWTDAAVDLSLDYHLYKISWTPTHMRFYLDSVQYGVWDITPAYLREFHQPCFVILNVAIGGWDPSYTGVYDPALVTASFPAKMYVDWIRLESNAYTELYFGDDIEEVGNFGIYTETTPVENSLVYGDDTDPEFDYGTEAALYPWNNMTESATPPAASEGSECWSFDIAAGVWYGMGVFLPNHRNMKNYSDGYLHLDMRTTGTDPMKIGIKSSRGGEFWLPVGDETSEFGFARDGQWHEVIIPLNRYANTDFHTIHQMLMIAGDPPSSGFNLSIDNVWYEPSVPRLTPANGNFGVYTETALNKDAGEFILGTDGDFFIWENTLVEAAQSPYEGSESISLESAPGLSWFGAAFTPNAKHNLTAFRYTESRLHFALKTSSSTTFWIGMKSGNVDGVGQKWITFESGSDPYGFVRDGNWHLIDIPMSDIATEVDLSQVSQLFQVLGINGPISDIEFDDICFTGGGSPLIGDDNLPPTVSITSPVSGTFFDPGDNITIEADANDIDGTITKVEFFEGLNLLGEDLSRPYTYTWNSIPEGAYVLRAKATDSNDVSRTSLPVTIYVGTPELTAINVSPLTTNIGEGTFTQFSAGGLDQFGQPLAVSVDWSVSGGGVIDENGYFVAVDAGGPYTVTATETGGGALSNTASANVSAGDLICDYDVSGKVDLFDFALLAGYWMATDCDGTSNFCDGADHVEDSDVDFYDLEVLMYSWLRSIPPSVSITSPANGSGFDPGDNVTIDAAVVVNAAGTTITTVEFFEGANYLGEDTTEPYSYTWLSVPQGDYVLTAIATDNTGQSSTSGPVSISVGSTALVTNGGFESSTTGWTLNMLGASSTLTSSTESPRSGSNSAKFFTDWQVGDGGVKAEINQMVNGLSGSTSYDYELWVKGLMGPGGVAWSEIWWFNASSVQIGGTGLINLWAGMSDTTYQAKGGTYVSPAGTTKAQISIRLEGGAMAALNTMYVDDVSLSD
jgi:beta-glucanase (GH16 family)